MSTVTLHKSLLALTIAAVTPVIAAPNELVAPDGTYSAFNVPGSTHYDLVTIGSGVTLTGGVQQNIAIGGFVGGSSNGDVGTLDIQGTLSGASLGIAISSDSRLLTLNNAGSISASTYGVYAQNPSSFGPYDLTINQNGGSLSGSNSAIYAEASNIILNWNGGTITGAVRGVKTFKLNLDHADLSGDLNMPAGSTISMRLTADNSAPVLNLGSGNFTLGNGSTIKLSPSTNNFSVDNKTYTLILGNGEGAAPGLNVASDSAYLTVHGAPDVDNYAIKSTVSIASAAQASSNIALAGGSPNAQRAGGAITPLLNAMSTSNPNDPVLQALSGNQSVQTSEQLAPDVNGGALLAANTLASQADLNAIQRTQGLRGASAGDTFVERGLWLKALNSNANQDQRDGIEGFDANSNGVAIGADGKLNDQLTLGIAYSYLNSDIDSDGGNKTEIDGHAITLYSGFEQDAWFLDSSLTLGLNHNDSKRYIAGTTAKADYDSQMFGLNVLGGYGFKLDNGVLLEPRAAARYGRVDIDSYSEKGSIAALRVEDQRYEVAELGAGLRVAGSLPLGQGTLQPEAKVMVYHDFAADQVTNTASFTFGGSPFVANGASPARTRYEAGVGVDYKLAAVTLGLSYDYTGKEDFSADTFQAKVRYDF